MPDLKEAVYSVSCTVFKNETQLIAMGGIDARDELVKTIQMLDLTKASEKGAAEWEILNIQLPTPMSNMGLHLLAKGGLIVFGGWN